VSKYGDIGIFVGVGDTWMCETEEHTGVGIVDKYSTANYLSYPFFLLYLTLIKMFIPYRCKWLKPIRRWSKLEMGRWYKLAGLFPATSLPTPEFVLKLLGLPIGYYKGF
jgi:hypothetical protein